MPGAGARGDRRAAEGAVGQDHVDLDGRVAAAVQDLAPADLGDRSKWLTHGSCQTPCSRIVRPRASHRPIYPPPAVGRSKPARAGTDPGRERRRGPPGRRNRCLLQMAYTRRRPRAARASRRPKVSLGKIKCGRPRPSGACGIRGSGCLLVKRRRPPRGAASGSQFSRARPRVAGKSPMSPRLPRAAKGRSEARRPSLVAGLGLVPDAQLRWDVFKLAASSRFLGVRCRGPVVSLRSSQPPGPRWVAGQHAPGEPGLARGLGSGHKDIGPAPERLDHGPRFNTARRLLSNLLQDGYDTIDQA